MIYIQKSLIGVVAILHIYFLILEIFLWEGPTGRKAFRMTAEKAKLTAELAANQGLYNGFLAAGLIWSMLHPNEIIGSQIALFFLGCIFIAGVYGGYSVSRKIFFIQGIPALIAIVTCLIL